MAKTSDAFREIVEKVKGLKRSEQLVLAAFAVTVAAALVMLSAWGARPRYVPLVVNASDDEVREVTAVLEEKGESYRVESGGKVTVRSERKAALAGEISRRGLVPGGKLIGFAEIIDKDSFYTTRDRRRLMMRVALQNELALMIGNLSAVENAKVLLKEGREADIFGGGQPGGASITVRTRPGARLTQDVVSSIAGIVRSAAPNIEPGDITIVDARTNVTYRPQDHKDELFEAPGIFRLKEDVERALADKVRGMFIHMGVDAVVVVNAELDLRKVQEKVQEIDPQGRGPFTLKERRSKSTSSEPVRDGGVAGIEANRRPGTAIGAGAGITAGAMETAALPAASDTREDRDSTYTYSYLVREITQAPKGLAKVSASVVLFDRIVEKDGKVFYDGQIVQERMGDFQQLVATALGIEKETDIVVKHVPSAGPAPTAAGIGVETAPYWETASKAALLLLAAAAFAAAYLALRKLTRKPAAAGEDELPTAMPADRITQLQKAIRDQVTNKPERLARILSRWVVSK
ncbi:MAG TPA: hypothetical protein ENN09_04810 [Planctomycetes bacterium]|nr:hypothetical protein [Planctomycetota bacterium]